MLNSCMSKELYTSFQLLYINDKGQNEILFKSDRIITIFGIIFQHVVYYYNSCWDVVNNNIHSMITITKGTINIYFITITSRELILCCCCYFFATYLWRANKIDAEINMLIILFSLCWELQSECISIPQQCVQMHPMLKHKFPMVERHHLNALCWSWMKIFSVGLLRTFDDTFFLLYGKWSPWIKYVQLMQW